MEDYSNLTGKDFEFLITHPENFEIRNDVFDSLMTPDTIEWVKVLKHHWAYYQVGQDEFTYSWELPGIQMMLSDEMSYTKAKDIAEQVVTKLKIYSGLDIGLELIRTNQLIRLEWDQTARRHNGNDRHGTVYKEH